MKIDYSHIYIQRKKSSRVSIPSRDVTAKLSLGRSMTSLFPPREFGSDIPAGDGELAKLFLPCTVYIWSLYVRTPHGMNVKCYCHINYMSLL
jgi:hypothetical protein